MTEKTQSPGQVDLSLLGQEHVRRYIETNGEVGYLWNGVPTLLLTTIGRKSGLPRTTPMIFTRVNEKVIVIASNGGAAQHPAWFLNIQQDPKVKVQIKDELFDALASIAQGPEREMLWASAAAQWHFDVYAQRTKRKIPVVILNPA